MCSHLAEYYSNYGLKPYRLVNSYFSSSSTTKDKRRIAALNRFCMNCGSTHGLFSCLHCVYLGCRKHIMEHHFKREKHYIYLNLSHGHLFCFSCYDYVFDSKFYKIHELNQYKAAKYLKKSVSFLPWYPSESEILCLQQHQRKILTGSNRLGLRGLFNLGNSCFMNCVIQVLIHTPLLRDYFLSDKHLDCKLSSCIVCEISRIFQDFYSGKTGPITLHDLLVLIWKQASNLAGYRQQDAHEFFIASLNLLHTQFNSFRESSKAQQHDPCNCIVDEIFTGTLLSDLVCLRCQHVSPTFEPFKDLSLDLSFDLNGQPKSLINCLERFTRLEHLGANAKLICSKCNTKELFTKELKVETLPIIASFHLKRFEQTGLNDKKKISTFISFPDELDLTPFLSNKSQEGDRMTNRASAKYSLYAVVNHEGRSIDSGHYTSIVRQSTGTDNWIKCDDLQLTPLNITQVLNSEGYLLFYHKKVLEYN